MQNTTMVLGLNCYNKFLNWRWRSSINSTVIFVIKQDTMSSCIWRMLWLSCWNIGKKTPKLTLSNFCANSEYKWRVIHVPIFEWKAYYWYLFCFTNNKFLQFFLIYWFNFFFKNSLYSFNSVRDGNHTMFREYSYIHATPHNRASFVRLFWKCYRQIGKKGGTNYISYI